LSCKWLSLLEQLWIDQKFFELGCFLIFECFATYKYFSSYVRLTPDEIVWQINEGTKVSIGWIIAGLIFLWIVLGVLKGNKLGKQQIERQKKSEDLFNGNYHQFGQSLRIPTKSGNPVPEKIARSFGHNTMLYIRDNEAESTKVRYEMFARKMTALEMAESENKTGVFGPAHLVAYQASLFIIQRTAGPFYEDVDVNRMVASINHREFK